MSTTNIDDKLVSAMQPAAEAAESAPEPAREVKAEHTERETTSENVSQESGNKAATETESNDDYGVKDAKSASDTTKSDNQEASSSEIDDYGNPVAPAKTYTEEEVQRMIRDRLSRGQQGQQATQQQVQQAAQDFIPDPNSEDTWETQLEGFIEKSLTKVKQKEQQREWKEQEDRTQAEFESKFSAGIAKYPDWSKTVAGKPITDAMMMATRAMKDPAAFIYAASKLQPKELERIATLRDPYQQATEIGRLEERMKKARSGVSQAAKPLSPTKGDMGDTKPKRNIDDLIRIDAKRKFR